MTDIEAHITGTVWKIECAVGDAIEEGDTVAILESMKMEMPVEAEDSGTVAEILCEEGQAVNEGKLPAPLPAGKSVFYGKHMTHHLLPEVDRAALAPLRHAHLIRDPRELLASYARVRTEPTLDDLGLRQQAEIFETFGGPVVDSRDLLTDPEGILRALCQALDVPFHSPLNREPWHGLPDRGGSKGAVFCAHALSRYC